MKITKHDCKVNIRWRACVQYTAYMVTRKLRSRTERLVQRNLQKVLDCATRNPTTPRAVSRASR